MIGYDFIASPISTRTNSQRKINKIRELLETWIIVLSRYAVAIAFVKLTRAYE